MKRPAVRLVIMWSVVAAIPITPTRRPPSSMIVHGLNGRSPVFLL
ncbi:MAG TPA: hypothetical protein PLD59_11170 [Tepidisphaeraceae bacterium]|nr:hypothetical protein [Tepidisphaeraceae bacterium]